MCGVNKNTTHRLYGLLRQRVVVLAQAEARPFVGGIVEIDESYFGPRRVRGKRGRGAGRKVPVIGLLKRAGKVFVQIVPNCSKTELLRVVHGQVKGATTIHTDGWKAYDGLVWDGFKHLGCITMKTNLPEASGTSTASNPSGALPKPGSPNSAGCGWANSRSTSRNPNGAGITAVITSTRCS
jgi:transposase-like protein